MARSIFIFSLIFLVICGCSNRNIQETASPNVKEEEANVEVENEKLDLQVDVNVTAQQAEFIITLINHTNELKKLEFPTNQKYEIIVKDESDREVYRYSEGKMFTQAIEIALIKQGEKIEWHEMWEFSDGNSKPGKYVAEVSIVANENKQLVKKLPFTITE